MADNFGSNVFSDGSSTPPPTQDLVVTDGNVTVDPTYTLYFDTTQFQVTNSGGDIAYINSKVIPGSLVSFRVTYDFANDGWNAGAKTYPNNQQTVPPGTYKLMGWNVTDASLTWAGDAYTVQFGIENIGGAGQDFQLFFENGTSLIDPSLFQNGGQPVNVANAGAGWYNCFGTYSSNNITNNYPGPSLVRGTTFTIQQDGVQQGIFYFNDLASLATVTAGTFEIEIVLKKVA